MLTIHRTFGVDLAPRDFFTDPTITGLAVSVERELAKHLGELSTVETEKPLTIEAIPVLSGAADALPIFLCIGRNGSLDILMSYQELIRRLGKQRSLYGLVARGGDDADAIYSTVGELVDTALAAVRRVQPRGPYLLIGECIGGKLAYEMARKLTQAGEQVAFLALLDASSQPYRARNSAINPTLKSIQRLTLKWYGRFFYHMRQMFELGWKDGANYLVERLAAVLPASLHSTSTYRPQYLAHKRYFDLLTQHEPSEPYDHLGCDCAVTAVFSHEYYHYADKWATLIPHLEVVKVAGAHTDYLSVSGGEVATRIRKALESAPLTSRDANANVHDQR
jgi:thioesterase domain-containing protein